MKAFVGRKRELSQFAQLLQKRQASLVVCQGRRRIGKSTPPSLSVRTGLIYEGKLHPDVREADYFDFLVPFADLLDG